MKQQPKVLVIVGQTASGKTSLAITLAKALNGEVISADSRQVYKGLNLGTGKVTEDEMQGIPHHLIDVTEPNDTYTVHDFVQNGRQAITDIQNRHKLPIVAGGTFLYIDALLGAISTPEVPPNHALRKSLSELPTEKLHEKLQALDSDRAQTIDRQNPHRLIRAIEVATVLGHVPTSTQSAPYNTLKLGISIEKSELHKNIHTRLIARINEGMINEVRELHKSGLSYERMEALGLEYRYISRYIQGLLGEEEMLAELETKIRQYAKRQMTWLKRDESIVWVNPRDVDSIMTLTKNFLAD